MPEPTIPTPAPSPVAEPLTSAGRGIAEADAQEAVTLLKRLLRDWERDMFTRGELSSIITDTREYLQRLEAQE